MPRKPHPLEWLVEPLEEIESYVARDMFGCRACYCHGRLMVVLASQGEPWQGLLVATERAFHASLVTLFPALSPHPVLGKWLYLPEECEGFERDAAALVALAARGDPRLGVAPDAKRAARKKAKKKVTKKGKRTRAK